MLLDEHPATLIYHTINNFGISSDLHTVSRIKGITSELQQTRDRRLGEVESSLKKLTRQLTTLSNHHSETLASHSSTSHASEIATLDTTKFRIAKSAHDLEIECERMSSQLADLQSKLQELEIQGVEGGAASGHERGPAAAQRSKIEDEMYLKCAIYRSLGFRVDRNERGEYTKVSVGDTAKGDFRMFDLDPNFSPFWTANYCWNIL